MMGGKTYMIHLNILQQSRVIKFTRFAGGRRQLATNTIKRSTMVKT